MESGFHGAISTFQFQCLFYEGSDLRVVKGGHFALERVDIYKGHR